MAISRSGKARLVRAGVLDRGFPIFHRGGPCSVVIGELEKTTARICVGGIAGEAAATLGLLVKGVKTAPSDSLATRRESPPLGALSRRRLHVVAGNVLDCIDFMSGRRLISRSGRAAGDSEWFPRALYSRGRYWCSELRHGLSPARSRRPDGPTAQA